MTVKSKIWKEMKYERYCCIGAKGKEEEEDIKNECRCCIVSKEKEEVEG